MFRLSEAAQTELLELARNSIRRTLQESSRQLVKPAFPELLHYRGAFVTLHRGGSLRGCIGVPYAISPLYQTVQECAISAAVSDPRFSPLTLPELDEVEIEISVLSPLEKVTDAKTLEIGLHGLAISYRGRRGLLLPQVAKEHAWDRERFLQMTCRKAGLPENSWRMGAKVECFTAFVFAEGNLNKNGD